MLLVPWSSSPFLQVNIYCYYCHFISHTLYDVSIDDLMLFIQKPLGIHKIRTKLYSLPLSKLYSLYNLCLETPFTNRHSNQYKLTAYFPILQVTDFSNQFALGKMSRRKNFLNFTLPTTLSNILHLNSVSSAINS